MVLNQGAVALTFCVMQKQMIHFQQHRGVADDPALHHPLLLPHLLPQLLPHILLPVVVPPDQHTTYWVGQHPLSVLPKRGPVLSRLLALSEPKTGKNRQISDALEQVVLEVKEVWALHTHPSWIFGSISEQIIMQDPDICDLLRDLYKTWYHLEYDSRRPRSSSKSFLKAKEDFEENMTLPFDIRKVTTYEQTMSSSGVLDWEEDLEYLKGQMTKEQPGCLSSIDQRQLQCDKRREERRRQEAARLEKEEQRRVEEEEALYEGETEEDDEDMLDVNDNDATYEDDRMRKRPKKIDVMGPIGQASDAKNLSVSQALTILC